MLVTQLCLTLCNPTDCSPPDSSVPRGYWSGLPFPSPGDLPHPGMEPGSPVLQVDSLLTEPPGKPSRNLPLRLPPHLSKASPPSKAQINCPSPWSSSRGSSYPVAEAVSQLRCFFIPPGPPRALFISILPSVSIHCLVLNFCLTKNHGLDFKTLDPE